MSKPDDIPAEVWAEAITAADAVLRAAGSGLRHYSLESIKNGIIEKQARALLAAEKRGMERATKIVEADYGPGSAAASSRIAAAIRRGGGQ